MVPSGSSSSVNANKAKAPETAGLKKPRLSVRKKVFFALATVVILLGITELGLRLLFPRLGWGGSPRYYWESDTHLTADRGDWPTTYPKNAHGMVAHLEFDVRVAFNADGFRGPDFDPSKGPTVIFVGDSTTAGHGVKYEEMFTVLIEKALRKRFPKVQVWNLGRGGTGTVSHVRILERILERYPTSDVRVVVLVTSTSSQNGAGNDLVDLRPYMAYLEGGRPDRSLKTTSLKAKLYSVRRIAIAHACETLIARWRRESFRLPAPFDMDKLWQNYYKCVDRARELCDRRGCQLMVAFQNPVASDKPQAIQDSIGRFKKHLEPLGIPLVLLTPQVSELKGKLWFYPIDGHPNAMAHRYFAQQITAPLVETLEACGLNNSPQ